MLSRSNILRRRLKRWLIYAGWAVIVVAKAFFLLVTGCRKLKLEKVMVNDAFLLSNGLLVLQWKAKRLLWVIVQDKWVGGRGNQIMLFTPGAETLLSIRLRGLFSSYTRCFSIVPVAALEVGTPSVPEFAVRLAANQFYPVVSTGLMRITAVVGRSIAPYFAPMEFNIPSIQIDNHDDKRLL